MGDVRGYHWLDDDGPAFGAPGVEPRWTSSQKDAVSTAYSASSRVWFTLSHGTLNEIYYPTIAGRRRATWSCCLPTARTSSTKRSGTLRTTSRTSSRTRWRCG